jgi:hypothetical protein
VNVENVENFKNRLILDEKEEQINFVCVFDVVFRFSKFSTRIESLATTFLESSNFRWTTPKQKLPDRCV